MHVGDVFACRQTLSFNEIVLIIPKIIHLHCYLIKNDAGNKSKISIARKHSKNVILYSLFSSNDKACLIDEYVTEDNNTAVRVPDFSESILAKIPTP